MHPSIAVINDDTDFLNLMSDLLSQEAGCEVHVCKESAKAYQFVKELRPRLVILDIRLDGQEAGWAILECLTLDPATSAIPVIVCSAAINQLRDQQERLETLGIDTLPKPFDLDMLLQKVRAGLARGLA
jgi:DNA-binding response OmpR family regulator